MIDVQCVNNFFRVFGGIIPIGRRNNSFLCFFIKSEFDNSRRTTSHNGKIGNIFVDKRISADHSTVADGNAAPDNCIYAYPNIVFNNTVLLG